MISKSGSIVELLRLFSILRQFHSLLIAIVGNPVPPLAEYSSSTTALAVEALAVTLMHVRNFTDRDFPRYQSDIVLDAQVKREAGSLNLAPTTLLGNWVATFG